MKRVKQILTGFAVCAVAAVSAQTPSVEERVEEMLSRMTLAEKVGQMNQPAGTGLSEEMTGAIRGGMVGSLLNELDPETVNALQRIAVEESRLGIPLLFARDVIHGFKTIFPIPLGQAASWDPSIVETGAMIAAREASSVGIRWTFAPMIDISRDPRWGRIAESLGEDAYLTSILGAAMIKGFQGNDLTAKDRMAACAKHFAGYGACEAGKDYNTTWIPEPQLREVYFPPFKTAADADAASFMCSFNDINGVPSSGNPWLNRTVLRDEWNYDGVLVSDWGSIEQMVSHGYSTDLRDAALKAVGSAVDMDMMSFAYINYLAELVLEGDVNIAVIDECVRNILRMKFRLGLFDNPYVESQGRRAFYCEDALATARKATAESAVLLKNNGILPLKGIKRLAVIGPLADSGRDQIGTWCFDAEPERAVTPLQAIRGEYPDIEIIYEAGLAYSRDRDAKGIYRAVRAAKKADAVLCFVGEEAILSGEARSRADISLPGAQTEMVECLKATGKPIVVVVMAGRPLTVSRETELADAVLYSFHAGTMAGPGIADVLFGKIVPCGKLPVTFPRMVGQVPVYYNHKNTGRPANNITLIDDIPVDAVQTSIGFTSYHLDAGDAPLFPFGYGLSYTLFEYGTVELSSSKFTVGGNITASCEIRNTGTYDAHEVVQLYIRDRVASLVRPVRELKGFNKVFIKAGETATVEFRITVEDIAFWHQDGTFCAEEGEFDLWISGDSLSGIPVGFTLSGGH